MQKLMIVEPLNQVFFFQAVDDLRHLVRSRGLGDVYKILVRGSRQGRFPAECEMLDTAGPFVCCLITSGGADGLTRSKTGARDCHDT